MLLNTFAELGRVQGRTGMCEKKFRKLHNVKGIQRKKYRETNRQLAKYGRGEEMGERGRERKGDSEGVKERARYVGSDGGRDAAW